MTWVIAIVAALVAFAVAVVVFRLPRATWTSLAAALVFGLAGYTLQASPTIPAAPKSQALETYTDEWEIVPARQLLIGQGDKSADPAMMTADAFARRGQFIDAAGFLRGVLARSPRDFEAWVALGNALTEQADGQLTQAALYAYAQANQLRPTNPAPGYFLGLSLIRQGRMMEARSVWGETLAGMGQASGEGADPAREFMVERIARLESMLQQMGAVPDQEGAGTAPAGAVQP
jgi:cytochrome c-type biogenesis protein CcmH